jgi:hypothetical protein
MEEAGLQALPLIEMPAHTQADFAAIEPWLQGPAGAQRAALFQRPAGHQSDQRAAPQWLERAAQLSVMGFDGIALGTQMHPTLCSVVQPIAEQAYTVIDQLLAQIVGAHPVSHCLPCHIRPGESTRPYEDSSHDPLQ